LLGCLAMAIAGLSLGCSRDPAALPPVATGSSVAATASGAPASTGAKATSGPAVGDAAPEFELMGSDGKVHRLSDHRGKEAVVVAWFPKAFTGG
jgi:hypothetical protein